MYGVRTASRMALICNIAFLGCVLLRYVPFIQNKTVTSLLLILGWVMAVWINVAVNVTLGLLLWRWGGIKGTMPGRWLMITNAGILLFQLFYYLLL